MSLLRRVQKNRNYPMTSNSPNTLYKPNAWWLDLLTIFFLAILFILASDKIQQIGFKMLWATLRPYKDDYTHNFNVTDFTIEITPPDIQDLDVKFVHIPGSGHQIEIDYDKRTIINYNIIGNFTEYYCPYNY